MFIEFTLPQDKSYGYVLNKIKNDVANWAISRSIKYTEKTTPRYTHRVAFDNDAYYTLFATSWDSVIDYKIIDRK